MRLEQSIDLKSIKNARELGGYRTTDGKAIKKGVFLRTAKLFGTSNEDINSLVNIYKVSDIIDFRSDFEITGLVDPEIENAVYHHLDVLDIDGIDKNATDKFDLKNPDLKAIVQAMDEYGLNDGNVYVGFLEGKKGKESFREYFRIILDLSPDRAVLWHCTSGKDRTGLAAMLLLSAFGVDESTIMSDYLLTNKYNAKQISGLKMMLEQHGYDEVFIKKAITAFEAVDESYMRNALDHLNKAYGSPKGYIINVLGITDTDIETLKKRYLEEI